LVISLSRRFVFVHLHKCAGTSVEVILSRLLTANDIIVGSTPAGQRWEAYLRRTIGLGKHATAAEIREFLGAERWEEFFCFAFVRAPLDRLFSFYRFSIDRTNRKPLSDDERRRFETTGDLPDRSPYDVPSVRAAMASRSFSDFVLSPDSAVDRGTFPQWLSVCDYAGNRLVDMVCKVETIDQDWTIISQRFDIDEPLPTLNPSRSERAPALTPEAAAFVAERYARDYEMFGYPPGT